MSITLAIINRGIGKLPGVRHLAKWNWGGEAFRGLGHAGALAAGTTFGYYSYAHDYGNGTAAMYGLASTYPITGIPLQILEWSTHLADKAYKFQQSKRSTSFVKNQIDDRFGTIRAMKQASIQQMRKDHSARQRVIGNEAFYLHR